MNNYFMKKYLLLLLFIPLMSLGQEITYDELMTINSEDTFMKVVIENGYEFYDEDEQYVRYGVDITRDKKEGDTSFKWAIYEKEFGIYLFQYVKNNIWVGKEYNDRVRDIKSNCEYFEISDKYATYNCTDSLFDGTIGFMTSEGSGFIQMIPNIDSLIEKD